MRLLTHEYWFKFKEFDPNPYSYPFQMGTTQIQICIKKKKMEREKKENMENLRFLPSYDGPHLGPFDTVV